MALSYTDGGLDGSAEGSIELMLTIFPSEGEPGETGEDISFAQRCRSDHFPVGVSSQRKSIPSAMAVITIKGTM
jgi:hypothetical protein